MTTRARTRACAPLNANERVCCGACEPAGKHTHKHTHAHTCTYFIIIIIIFVGFSFVFFFWSVSFLFCAAFFYWFTAHPLNVSFRLVSFRFISVLTPQVQRLHVHKHIDIYI